MKQILDQDPWESRKPLLHDTIKILEELKCEGKISEICSQANENIIFELQLYFDQILCQVCL